MYPGKWPVTCSGPSSTLRIKTINYGVTAGLTSTEGGRKAQHPSKLTSRSSLLTLHTWAKACMTGGRVRIYHMNSWAEPSTSHSGSHAGCYCLSQHWGAVWLANASWVDDAIVILPRPVVLLPPWQPNFIDSLMYLLNFPFFRIPNPKPIPKTPSHVRGLSLRTELVESSIYFQKRSVATCTSCLSSTFPKTAWGRMHCRSTTPKQLRMSPPSLPDAELFAQFCTCRACGRAAKPFSSKCARAAGSSTSKRGADLPNIEIMSATHFIFPSFILLTSFTLQIHKIFIQRVFRVRVYLW